MNLTSDKKQRLKDIYEKIKKEHAPLKRKRELEKKPLYYKNGRATKQDKAPKLKFRPGNIMQHQDGSIYEIIYCYRTRASDGQWMFCLESRTGVERQTDFMSELNDLVLGVEGINRIEYRLFSSDMDAMQHFHNIACRSDYRVHVGNQKMLNDYRKISEGPIE